MVLNKIDTLWDELSSAPQIQAQIEVQKLRTAQALGVDPLDVLAVSAQKGLVAKVSGNADLLQRSGLLALEAAKGLIIIDEIQRSPDLFPCLECSRIVLSRPDI